MQGSKQFKQALLESLLLGLRKRCVAASRGTGFHERKRAIRLAADAALANARGADATRWSRTLLAASELAHRRQLTRGAKSASVSASSKLFCESVLRTRRIHRPSRSRKAGTAAKACDSAGALARAVMRKRTRVLKGLVPGAEALDDECTLLRETLDYAVCLKAQVDVMQFLVRVLAWSSCKTLASR